MGARVHAFGPRPPRGGRDGRPLGALGLATTGPDGRAWFGGMPRGEARVVARAPGLAPGASDLMPLDPERAATVIHIGDDPVGQMARVHARIEAGDFVALLGDRTGLNERTVEATFLGETAQFPAGPFLLASLMKCPVYLTFGLYRRPNRYELSCEPFAERLELPRRDREAALKDVVQRYADRLAHRARSAPYNWFNFYDFWQRPPGDAPTDGGTPTAEQRPQAT